MKEKMTVENFVVGFQWSLVLHKGKELSQKLLQVSYCTNLVAELSGLQLHLIHQKTASYKQSWFSTLSCPSHEVCPPSLQRALKATGRCDQQSRFFFSQPRDTEQASYWPTERCFPSDFKSWGMQNAVQMNVHACIWSYTWHKHSTCTHFKEWK